jgi:hypothetical protein
MLHSLTTITTSQHFLSLDGPQVEVYIAGVELIHQLLVFHVRSTSALSPASQLPLSLFLSRARSLSRLGPSNVSFSLVCAHALWGSKCLFLLTFPNVSFAQPDVSFSLTHSRSLARSLSLTHTLCFPRSLSHTHFLSLSLSSLSPTRSRACSPLLCNVLILLHLCVCVSSAPR